MWTNARRGDQDETEPGTFPRVKRSPYGEDVYMETPSSSSPTRRTNSPIIEEDGRGPYDDFGDDEDWTWQQRGSNSTNNFNRRLSFDGSVSE